MTAPSIFTTPYASEKRSDIAPETLAIIQQHVAYLKGVPTLVLDFETFYAKGFSLSSLAYDEYCFDAQFQAITCGYVRSNGDGATFDYGVLNGKKALGDALLWALKNKAVIVAHNNFFDAMVIYRIVTPEVRALLPQMRWACTQMLAKQFHPQERHSLAKLATRYELPDKGKEVTNALGMRREDFSPTQMAAYVKYCLHDAGLCFALFANMYPRLTMKQRFLMAWHHWMYVGPQFLLDVPRLQIYDEQLTEEHRQRMLNLADALATEDKAQEWSRITDEANDQGQDDPDYAWQLLDALDDAKVKWVESELQSSAKFAEVLRWLGVDPPMQVSRTTGKQSYAFSKSNKEFTDLQEHDDELVAAAVSGRLGVKSSILRTRTRRLIGMGERFASFPGIDKPWFSVAISYYGALTGRGAGTNGTNPQNFTKNSELRRSLIAPPGYLVVVADSANIEMRIAHCISGQNDTIEKVRNGVDLYCDFAGTEIFNREITKADKLERTIGKVAMLSLQYWAGKFAFQRMLWAQARVRKDIDFCDLVVKAFRMKHQQLHGFVVNHLSGVLWGMSMGRTGEICLTPYTTHTLCEVDGFTPVINFHDQNGQRMSQLRYPNLMYDETMGQFLYGELKRGYWVELEDETTGDTWYKFVSSKDPNDHRWPTQKLYHGGLLENICQHLANVVLTDIIYNVFKKFKVYPALQVHDEVVYVVPEAHAQAFAKALDVEMCKPLPWWPKLPLGAETHVAANYGDAK